jgi:hypothetical protein
MGEKIMILENGSQRISWARMLILASIMSFAGLIGAPFAASQTDTDKSAAADAATTDKDQTDLAVTVYNSDLALVRRPKARAAHRSVSSAIRRCGGDDQPSHCASAFAHQGR